MKQNILFLMLISFSLLSCVSKKKYTELQDARTSLKNEVLELRETKADYVDLQRKYRGLQESYQQEQKDLLSISSQYDNLNNAHERLQGNYDLLLEKNKALMRAASEEKESLSQELMEKQQKLTEKEYELNTLSRELKNQQRDLTELQDSLQAREGRIHTLQSQLDAQKKELTGVRNQIVTALLDFPKEDLTIEQKDGKIYVSLSQNLLFATGSDKIDPKGISALEKLANVLKDYPKIDIVVEGHTDSEGSIRRNWQLSTERALSVVKVLQDNAVDPERLTASGRAFYAPIAPNDSKENMALNRRTEIILSPDLSKLYKLINIQ